MADPAPRPATVEDIIRSMVRRAADGLDETEQPAIDDAPDGVHQHRTEVRRLRSVLAGFRRYLDEAAARDLRVQFKEWGAQLGVVRDIEVRAAVALAAMDDLGIDDDKLRDRLVDAEYRAYARAHARLRELHEGPRAAARMAALTAFAEDPPLAGEVDADAGTLSRVGRKEARRVARAATHSDGSIESLHAVRKAGRRLRYVAEALHEAAPEIYGDDFAKLAAAGETVHDALGSHRDELIFIEHLQQARAQAGRQREPVEPYDRLIERAGRRADESLSGLQRALKDVRHAAKAL
jgi:CHAD domain-containing protein